MSIDPRLGGWDNLQPIRLKFVPLFPKSEVNHLSSPDADYIEAFKKKLEIDESRKLLDCKTYFKLRIYDSEKSGNFTHIATRPFTEMVKIRKKDFYLHLSSTSSMFYYADVKARTICMDVGQDCANKELCLKAVKKGIR